MKIYILTAAMVLLFSIFTVFQMDNNNYLLFQERLKTVANDAADSAALFYDEGKFSDGIKVFDKASGNAVILKVLTDSLPVDASMNVEENKYVEGQIGYKTYYFDGTGYFTTYDDGVLSSVTSITYPYNFEEESTNYAVSIEEPTVIVTIDAGTFDYSLPVLTDPEAIRTSGYEYVQY